MSLGAGLRDESGMSMAEVMITLLISMLTITALAQFFVNASHSSLSGTRQVSVLELAQKQIEQIRQQVTNGGFDTLGLTGLPTEPDAASEPPGVPAGSAPTEPTDPLDLVTGTSFQIEENYNVPGIVLATEPFVTGGTIVPIMTGVSAGGGATATMYTFVTQVPDICNATLPNGGSCGGAANADVRRVVVAVQLDATSALNGGRRPAPQYVTTVISNPVPTAQVNSATGLRIGLNVG